MIPFQELDITGSYILSDKTYGSEAIRNWITSKQTSFTIPPKANNQHLWQVD